MRTHVVAVDWQSDQVLARLCAILVQQTGWTVSAKPDPRAEINLFFPYLNWVTFSKFKGTQTAGWFTHRDTGNRAKEKMWIEAANNLDIRFTSARLYYDELIEYGPTVLVTPPVDHERFYVDPGVETTRINNPPRIGVSGTVYPGGRKGEYLVKDLMQQHNEWQVVGSGTGWPCPSHQYSPENLGDYYRSLDVFLCTSLIEGIPLPPLEAMACGVPIVIPRGVGMLDELPALQNVFRYDRGDYATMERAVIAALREPVNADSLTATAARFTDQVWAQGFVDAAVGATAKDDPVGELAAWEGRAGVYYVAYGDPARECAKRAIDSLHRWMPTVPCALVSDSPLGSEDVSVVNADEDIGARSVKTKIYDLAPSEWQYVLYLDSDTEVVGQINYLFDALVAGWELVICTNPAQYHLVREMRRPDNAEEIDELIHLLGGDELLQYNGGVFGFRRCDRVQRFFERWHEEWKRYGKRDQAALDRALYAEPLRVLTLGRAWNCITRYDQPNEDTAITHYPLTARRWRGVIQGRLDSTEAWAALHPEPQREPQPRKPGKPKLVKLSPDREDEDDD